MQPTRRQTLAGLVATAVTGLPATQTADAAWWGNKNNNLYDILGDYKFSDQSGNTIGRNGIEALLKGRNVVLSFFYKGCGATDPEILTQQAKLAEAIKPAKLIHLVINTNPFSDSIAPETRDAFLDDMTKFNADRVPQYPVDTQYLQKENTIVLYPLNEAGKPFDSQEEMVRGVKAIERAAGGLVITSVDSKDVGHYSRISLYGPDGNAVLDPATNKPLAERAATIVPQQWANAAKAQQGMAR